MRLFEFSSNDVVDNLETILRQQIGRNNSKDSPLTLSHEALSNLLKNTGFSIEVNQQVFQNIYDNNPDIQALIINFDKDKIVLATEIQSKKPEDQQSDLPVPSGGPSVDSMASQGAKAYLKKQFS